MTFLGVAGKTLLFVPLFVWARHSDLGAACLRGAVAADLFTWIVLSIVEWPFRRFRVGIGAVFEIVLVALYLNRGTLFEIGGNVETTAISALFFFFVLVLKAAAWSVEHTLEITGVKEPS